MRDSVSRLQWPASGDSQYALTQLFDKELSNPLLLALSGEKRLRGLRVSFSVIYIYISARIFWFKPFLSVPILLRVSSVQEFLEIRSVLEIVLTKKMGRRKCLMLTRRARKAAQAQCWVNAWPAWPQANQRPEVAYLTNQRQDKEDSSWLGKANTFCQFHNWTQKVRK